MFNLGLVGKYITGKKWSPFYLTKSAQIRFINSLPSSDDDFVRSYNQYLCQRLYLSRCKLFFVNFLSAMLILPYLLVCIFFSFYYLIFGCIVNIKSCAMVFYSLQPNSDIIPQKVNEMMESRPCVSVFSILPSLNFRDMCYIFTLYNKYPFSFYFLLKQIVYISIFSSIIRRYKPSYIIISREYSFSSSLLTNYSERNKCLLLNIMHGQKGFYIRDAFCRFSIFFVWSDFFKDMFISMGSPREQFVISLPNGFIIPHTDIHDKIDYKYYLGNEDHEHLLRIKESLLVLSSKGYSIKIRPHPIYSDKRLIYSVFGDNYTLEDPSLVPINESIDEAKNVVALFSTVLLRAGLNGKRIVIDDVDFPQEFSKMEYVNPNILACPHMLLSDLISLSMA